MVERFSIWSQIFILFWFSRLCIYVSLINSYGCPSTLTVNSKFLDFKSLRGLEWRYEIFFCKAMHFDDFQRKLTINPLNTYPTKWSSTLNEALDFVQDAVTELTTEKGSFELPSNTLCSGINNRPTLPSTISYQPSIMIFILLNQGEVSNSHKYTH